MEVSLRVRCSFSLDVSPAVDDVAAGGGDVDGVQNGPQYLAKRSGDESRSDECPQRKPCTMCLTWEGKGELIIKKGCHIHINLIHLR